MSKEEKTTLLAENRRDGFNYAIEESLECGIVLKGAEVKSLRERHLSFRDAYALLKDGELYIIGLRIENYPQATHDILDPERTRKLLLARWQRAVSESGSVSQERRTGSHKPCGRRCRHLLRFIIADAAPCRCRSVSYRA